MFKKHGLHIRTKSENQTGDNNNNSYNPNPIYTKDGYVEIWDGEKRELEHRFVMKEHLKRELLGTEIIHHINGIKDDNRLVNLKIVTSSSHRKEHKLPKEEWSKNYECCIKCGTKNKKHAGNGYCSKCYMYVRTVEKRGYECEYDEEGNRNFSEEHVENIRKSLIGHRRYAPKGRISVTDRNAYARMMYHESPKRKLWTRARYHRRRALGILTIDIIQSIYEENILLFGELTCVYCMEKIQFGKDSIDHVIPISKGGRNDKENLVIACRRCNSSKCNNLWGGI